MGSEMCIRDSSQEVLMETMNSAVFGISTISAVSAGGLSTAVLPIWGSTLLMGLWQLAVAIFYLPVYQCVELGYFEVAKSTSGVGEGASSRSQNPWSSGPDNMGGF